MQEFIQEKSFTKELIIKKYSLKDKENHVSIYKEKSNILVKVNNKHYKVLKTPEKKNKSIVYINMPWINDGNGHLLKDGAFRINIK